MTSPDAVADWRKRLTVPQKPDDRSSHSHRQLIGIIGLTLPIILLLIDGLRPTKQLRPWGILDSVSAYYYTGAAAAFVGALVALAAFLVTYQGYRNDAGRGDRRAAVIASAAAIGVAFFPTRAPHADLALFWWTSLTGTIHYVSAAVLFGALIYFALFLFTKSNARKRDREKRVRNGFYVASGVLMIGCMLWAASSYFTGASSFWPETIALWAFSVSWLVKGHFDWTVIAAGKRTLRYARHPRQLARDAWRMLQG